MNEENELPKLEDTQQLMQVAPFIFIFENLIGRRMKMVSPYQSKCHILQPTNHFPTTCKNLKGYKPELLKMMQGCCGNTSLGLLKWEIGT